MIVLLSILLAICFELVLACENNADIKIECWIKVWYIWVGVIVFIAMSILICVLSYRSMRGNHHHGIRPLPDCYQQRWAVSQTADAPPTYNTPSQFPPAYDAIRPKCPPPPKYLDIFVVQATSHEAPPSPSPSTYSNPPPYAVSERF